MLYIKDLNKLKITRIRDWRINFKYDDILYSLNCHEDGCDTIVALNNRDNGDCVHSEYENLYVDNYIRVNYNAYNKPVIYSHIDKKYFVKQLYKNGFVLCNNEIKNQVIEDKINFLKKDINDLQILIECKKKLIEQYETEIIK